MAREVFPPIGLDVGTSRLVIARRGEQEFTFDTQLNAFVTIPYSKMTESVLKKESVPHVVRGGEIVVHGNEAARFADLLGSEMRRPMTHGILNANEAEGIELLRQLVSTLAGPAQKPGQKIYFSVPAPPLGGSDEVTYHEAAVRDVLAGLGYDPRPVNEGMAVIYSELESTNYSGIGISFGGGLCNVALAYMSMPVLSFSIPKGGDFVDASAASVTGELANRIRIAKEESFHFNGQYADKVHQVLSVYYDDMITTLVAGLKDALSSAKRLPKLAKPVPVVLGGGSALPPGFRDRFEKVFRAANLPLAVSEIRLAEQPLYSTAKGALVAGLAEL